MPTMQQGSRVGRMMPRVLATVVVAAATLVAVPVAAMQQASVSATAPARRLSVEGADEVLALVNELRAREARLLQQLANTPAADVPMRRALEAQLARTSREAFALMSAIESRCLDRGRQPRGRLGVVLTSETETRQGQLVLERITVTSVEPGSPAERGGVEAGDVVVTIAGRDARVAIESLGEVLEPGRRIALRVRREGKERDLAVTVGEAPPVPDACPQFERAVQPLRMGGVARVWVQDSVDGNGTRRVFVRELPMAPTPPTPPAPPAAVSPRSGAVAAVAPTPPAPPAPPTAPMVFLYGSGNGATGEVGYFNGAQFRVLGNDWREVLGVPVGTDGVLVNEVAVGSAAAASGLRAGDVILTVDGTAATSPIVVVRLLALADAPQSTLRVIRARETRTVQFRRVQAQSPRP